MHGSSYSAANIAEQFNTNVPGTHKKSSTEKRVFVPITSTLDVTIENPRKKSSQQWWIITNLQYDALILISAEFEFKGSSLSMLIVQLIVNFCCFKLQKLAALLTKLKSDPT